MADLIAQEQHASDDEADGFMEAPHWYMRRKKQPGPKHPVSSAASPIADNNFFSNLLVEGGEDVLEEGDEDYAATDSNSGSGSGSEGDEVEITNEEAHIIFIMLVAVANCNSLQLADSLPRKIIAEKTHVKKPKLKKRKAQPGSLSASSSFKKAHLEEVEDESEPSAQPQLFKVCYIHCRHFEAQIFLRERSQKLGTQSICFIPSPTSMPQKTAGTRATSTTSAAMAQAKFLLLRNT
jgi:hypothetical protein